MIVFSYKHVGTQTNKQQKQQQQKNNNCNNV